MLACIYIFGGSIIQYCHVFFVVTLQKKGYVCRLISSYCHIYIICFSLTPLTNANGFRFGNSMNGTKKSAKVDTVDVCVIGFTTLSKKEME